MSASRVPGAFGKDDSLLTTLMNNEINAIKQAFDSVNELAQVVDHAFPSHHAAHLPQHTGKAAPGSTGTQAPVASRKKKAAKPAAEKKAAGASAKTGLVGVSTDGVGSDIVNYLQEVARFFGITIYVTSGYRSADGQALAMYDNWEKMDHGQVYKKTTLPEDDRTTLDQYWTTAHDPTEGAPQKLKAKSDFLELAKARAGSKTLHAHGRAIDVRRGDIDRTVYAAITLQLHEVKEGKRTDIYHFESSKIVPAVNDAEKAKWRAIKDQTAYNQQTLVEHDHGFVC